MKNKSLYQKLLKKHYNLLHKIAYQTNITIGPVKISSPDILYKLYKKNIVYSSVFPAPRLHLFHPDKIETRHRRLQTVINENPRLEANEKIREYNHLKKELMNRMKQRKVKYSNDTRWVFNHLVKKYDRLISRYKENQMN